MGASIAPPGNSSRTLAHLDNSTAPGSTFENSGYYLGQFLQCNLVRNGVEQVSRLVVAGQAMPEFFTQFHRTVYRIDAQEVYTAQDKRENGRAEIRPSRIAAGSN